MRLRELPFTAGTVSFLAVGVVAPLDREDPTERRGIRLGVPSSVFQQTQTIINIMTHLNIIK